jgi:hypothetical protein
MKAWALVARKVCEAEFPAYEVMSAFHVFKLTDIAGAPFTLPASVTRSLRRLAAVYKVDAEKLELEYQEHLQRALYLRRTTAMVPKGCWRQAARQSLRLRKATRRSHPVENLHRVLKAYLAASISTSGVEQAWSKCDWLQGTGRAHASEHAEARMIKITVDYNERESDQIVKAARCIWSTTFGVARQGKGQFTKGVKRPSTGSGVATERAWIKRRRDSVGMAGSGNDTRPASGSGVTLPTEATNPTLAAEVEFQRKKEVTHRLRAMEEGALLEDEMDSSFEELVERTKRKEEQSARAKLREHLRADKAVQEYRAPRNLDGQTVFLDAGAPAVRQAAERRGCRVTTDYKEAKFITVSNPARVDLKFRWAAILGGCSLVTPRFWLNGRGAVITYIAAMGPGGIPRRIWASELFQHRYPGIFKLLRHFMDASLRAGARWRPITKAQFLAKPGSACLAVVTKAEQAADEDTARPSRSAPPPKATSSLVCRLSRAPRAGVGRAHQVQVRPHAGVTAQIHHEGG